MSTILIVEDDPIIRLSAEQAIQDWGYQTLTASDVESALEILRSPQQIDALFTDIYLKTVPQGGCDIAREGVMLRPSLRVLYVTGFTLIPKIRAMFVEGAECIGKPYTDAMLKEALDKMFTGALQSA